MDYEVTIGLEIHAQVLTNSKMFCGCSADYASTPPNTHVCPVCLGLPGALPVLNEEAVRRIALTGLALNCEIALSNEISRKQYHYPDLPSGYQRSQYDHPLCTGGWVEIDADGGTKRIGITRVHMEEDTGMSQHTADGSSLIDYNRSGVPLMEIVSEPDISSPEEARRYALKLRQILLYLGVNSGRMEEGALRVDANVSVRKKGSAARGTKVEIKNMNSFRAVERALSYEIDRQISVLEQGGRVVQETRGWDEMRGVTVSQRSKEFAEDYRYFPDPDLPPLELTAAWVEERRGELPELPDAKRARFMEQYGLSFQDADTLTQERLVADYYEQAVAAAAGQSKPVANWVLGELFRLLKESGEEIETAAARLQPAYIGQVIGMVARGEITGTVAKQVFEESYRTGQPPAAIVAERGLRQISDQSAISAVARQVVADHPKVVADYKSGKSNAIKFLVGQVMRATKGQANPQLAEQALLEELGRGE